MAATLLWATNIEETYQHPKIDQFVEATRLQLEQECISYGYRKPNVKDLIHMQEYGTFPDENI
jgi:hypothetical protein